MTLLFSDSGRWHRTGRRDVVARMLADGHYSRQTPGAVDFMGNGRVLVLRTLDGLAVWGAIENMDPAGGRHWRVSIFRNTGPVLSSDLVREGTERTVAYWLARYRALPSVPLRTEINPAKVRRKRDPGRCFLRAGWTRIGFVRGLVVLEAPGETERLASWR